MACGGACLANPKCYAAAWNGGSGDHFNQCYLKGTGTSPVRSDITTGCVCRGPLPAPLPAPPALGAAGRLSKCSVMDHDAKGDGTTLDTDAIAKAIEACDHVVFPADGQFLTGTIELRSKLTLEVRFDCIQIYVATVKTGWALYLNCRVFFRCVCSVANEFRALS